LNLAGVPIKWWGQRKNEHKGNEKRQARREKSPPDLTGVHFSRPGWVSFGGGRGGEKKMPVEEKERLRGSAIKRAHAGGYNALRKWKKGVQKARTAEGFFGEIIATKERRKRTKAYNERGIRREEEREIIVKQKNGEERAM